MKTALVLCFLAVASTAYAGDARFYDKSGNYSGRASQNNANENQWSTYSPDGRYTGRVMMDKDNPGNSRVYDQHGNYLGRASDQRPSQKKDK